jgi:hypothetical protein
LFIFNYKFWGETIGLVGAGQSECDERPIPNSIKKFFRENQVIVRWWTINFGIIERCITARGGGPRLRYGV